MAVGFDAIEVGSSYSRSELAELWGYASQHALARGVVTPRGGKQIILFVTRYKQATSQPYEDHICGGRLHWEGPTDHFAEGRMQDAPKTGDEIHLFYRERHHTDFTYRGQLDLIESTIHTDRPSHFVFEIRS